MNFADEREIKIEKYQVLTIDGGNKNKKIMNKKIKNL